MVTQIVFDSNSLSPDLTLRGIWSSNQLANARFLPNSYGPRPRTVYPGTIPGDGVEPYGPWVRAEEDPLPYCWAAGWSKQEGA